MTGRVDEVKLVCFAIISVVHHPDGLRLDRDATLALDVHRIEQLLLHVAFGHSMGKLQHAVGQGRLAVVDVRDDGEVAYEGGVSHRSVRIAVAARLRQHYGTTVTCG